MKISTITSRLTSYNTHKQRQQEKAFSFGAKISTPITKDILEVVKNKKVHLSKQQLRNLKLHELNIQNFRTVNPTSLSGGTFSVRSDIDLKSLKDAGIKTIIDFRGEATNDFSERCEQMGLKYYNFNLNNVINMANPKYFIKQKNKKTEITPEFINKLVEFFNLVNKGNAYMGCHFGIDRTNIGLIMNYLMNPKVDNAPEILTWPYERKKTTANKNIKVVKKIIKRMTPEQRKQLGIPEDYHPMLQTRIYNLLDKNGLL